MQASHLLPREGSDLEPIRLLVADDEKAVVDVLGALINQQADLELVGTAQDAEAAIALALKERPDVALLDVRMPGGGGLRATREIARRCPNTRVIALSAHEDEGTIIAMMSAGADAYVRKGDSTDRILRQIYRGAVRTPPSAGAADVWGGPIAADASLPAARKRERRERIDDVLEHDALTSAYRPIFDVGTGSMVGVESVVRIARLPVRSSDAWFAEAEAVGLREELESAAVRASLRALDEIPESAFLAIEISPGTAFEPALERAMHHTAAPRVVLEITEHALIEDYDGLNATLAGLRGLGVRIAVKDVGAGIATLHHVVKLEPDLLKIDASLTAGVESDPGRHAVVAALSSCARQLGAKVIAEGVTTLEQLEELTCLGIDYFQGFLLAEAGSLGGITWDAAFRAHPVRANHRAGMARSSEEGERR